MTDRKPRSYRVVVVSLYEDDVVHTDRWTDRLKRAGWPKANRSLVIREGLQLLREVLANKDDEAVFRYFVERFARRCVGGRSNQPRGAISAADSTHPQP